MPNKPSKTRSSNTRRKNIKNAANIVNSDKTGRKNTRRVKARSSEVPNVASIHVVNLDKDADRWRSIERKCKVLSPQPVRWAAVYGKDLVRTDMHKLGVGFAMIHSGRGSYDKQHKDLRNLGTVGCFLSHKNLLHHLSFMNVGGDAAHLILEDDADIPDNLLNGSGPLGEVYHQVPDDWDILYLGINTPIGENVRPNVKKLTHAVKDQGNWGTHAYMVRHRALKTKILPWLAWMVDALDLQLNIKFDEWNVYALDPSIVRLGLAAKKSTIQTM
jgi:GR25 family glycosyltransferase involved in LPS biosynthesis